MAIKDLKEAILGHIKSETEPVEHIKRFIHISMYRLPQDVQKNIEEIEKDLKISSHDIFFEILEHALSPLLFEFPVYNRNSWEGNRKYHEELWKRFKPHLEDDKFIEFANNNFNPEALASYRESKINSLKARWKGQLSGGSIHLLDELEGKFEIKYYPVEKELVEITKLPRSKFQNYEKETLRPTLIKLYDDKKVSTVNTDEQNKDRLIEVQNQKVKDLRNALMVARNNNKYVNRPTKEGLFDLADKCRFNKGQGRINFSALGKLLGKSYHTAKDWCKDYRII